MTETGTGHHSAMSWRPRFSLVLIALLAAVALVAVLLHGDQSHTPSTAGAGPPRPVRVCLTTRAQATASAHGQFSVLESAQIPVVVNVKVSGRPGTATVSRSAAVRTQAKASIPLTVKQNALASGRACATASSLAAARGKALQAAYARALAAAQAHAPRQAQQALQSAIRRLRPSADARAKQEASARAQTLAAGMRATLERQARQQAAAALERP